MAQITKKDILLRIEELRTKKGISPSEIAAKLGHAKTYIYRIETGEIELSVDTFLKILDILNTSPAQFFAPSTQSADQALLTALDGISEQSKALILQLAQMLK